MSKMALELTEFEKLTIIRVLLDQYTYLKSKKIEKMSEYSAQEYLDRVQTIDHLLEKLGVN
jgi:ribosome assembly protein YihI (activator of Der GTPase)